MTNIYKKSQSIPRTARNNRIYPGEYTGGNAPVSNGTGINLDWVSVTPEKVTINRDTHIEGNLTASEEVVAWVAVAVTSDVLAVLTATAPLRKSSASNLVLDYNTSQFEAPGGILQIKAGVLAPSAHSHLISDVTGLQSALDSKMVVHSHPYRPDSWVPSWSDVTGKPATFTPSAHGHLIADVTGLQAALDGKESLITKAAGFAKWTGSSWNFVNETYSLSSHNHSGTYEPLISAGTTAQYRRGDKTWQPLNTAAVPESGNLYYTQARFDTAFSGKTTSSLAEGTNLYFTNARVKTYADTLYRPIGYVPTWAEITSKPIWESKLGWDAANGRVTISTDLYVTGNILASQDVIAYVAGAVSSDVLAGLSATAPLRKSSASNIVLDFSTSQFEVISGNLQIKSGILTPSAHTHLIADVTGLQSALDSKMVVHTHPYRADSWVPDWADVTGKPSFLALGETSSTAYRGDRGKIAYDHSQSAHQSILNGTGFVKVSGTTVSYDNSTYLTAITKSQVEAVLTGNITSHSHSYLPLAGGTLTGNLIGTAATFSNLVLAPNIYSDSSAGTYRGLRFQTSGVSRWYLFTSSDAESGSNAGSNFYLTRYADDGSYLGQVLSIPRATGVINFSSNPTVLGYSIWNSSNLPLYVAADRIFPLSNNILDLGDSTHLWRSVWVGDYIACSGYGSYTSYVSATDFRIGATSINSAGTLSNVAYKNTVNNWDTLLGINLPAQGLRIPIANIGVSSVVKIEITSSENGFYQPIELTITRNSTGASIYIIRDSVYVHEHSYDVSFSSDSSGNIYAEKVTYATGRLFTISKFDVIRGTASVISGGTSITGTGVDESKIGLGRVITATNSSVNISGALTGTTANFTTISLNGVSINTAGTLSNVAYKGALTTNYIPKWDGTQLGNSIISDISGQYAKVEGTIASNGTAMLLLGSSTIGSMTSYQRGGLYQWLVGIGGSSSTNGVPTSYFGISESGTTPRLVIAHTSGFVGIGYTADPTSGNKLAVNGTAYINGNLTAQIATLTGCNTQSMIIKNSSGTTKWTISYNTSTDALEFKNASGVLELVLEQSGNLKAKGEVTAYATI